MKKLNKEQLLERAYRLLYKAVNRPSRVNILRWNNIAGVLRKRYGITIYGPM